MALTRFELGVELLEAFLALHHLEMTQVASQFFLVTGFLMVLLAQFFGLELQSLQNHAFEGSFACVEECLLCTFETLEAHKTTAEELLFLLLFRVGVVLG